MLKTKSFKLSDDTGVNELLTTYRLAAGASIFVSDGEIMVPYDDGEPANNAQRIIDIKLQINEMNDQKRVITHSNKVVENMNEQLQGKLATATADFESATNNKKFEAKKKQIEEQIEANDSAIRQNDYEIDRLDMNVKLFEEAIEELA